MAVAPSAATEPAAGPTRRAGAPHPVGRLAIRAPVTVFVANGCGSGLAANELAGDARVRLVDTPRRASVLLAVGAFPGHLGDSLARVRDQLPHPRAFLWWAPPGAPGAPGVLRSAVRIPEQPTGSDVPDRHGPAPVVDQLVEVNRRLLTGAARSYGDVRPDAPPNEFEGLGDHGQGGEGMMGGVPWGRPMAMTGEDRDGLALDRIEATLGPFLVGMPPATAARVVTQGGIVAECNILAPPPYDGPTIDGSVHSPTGHSPTGRDRRDDQLDTCRRELRWLVEACRLGGLDALAARTAGVATTLGHIPASTHQGDAVRSEQMAAIARVCRAVRRSGLARTWRGVGAGVAGDKLDAGGRLDRRLTALDAFARSGEGSSFNTSSVPVMRGPDRLEAVAAGLRGLDWTDAVVTLCSLDLSPDTPSVAP